MIPSAISLLPNPFYRGCNLSGYYCSSQRIRSSSNSSLSFAFYRFLLISNIIKHFPNTLKNNPPAQGPIFLLSLLFSSEFTQDPKTIANPGCGRFTINLPNLWKSNIYVIFFNFCFMTFFHTDRSVNISF